MGMRPYVVKQGDYLTRVAHDLGFHAEEAWAHPKNDELRSRREHEDILAPGDLIHVPPAERSEHPIEPEVVNRYRARASKVPLDLLLMDNDEPLADLACTIEGLGSAAKEGRTDGEGRIALQIPLHIRELRLVFPEKKLTFAVLVGHLDPITEPSGVRARLANLGYGEIEDGDREDHWDEQRLADAIRSFQSEEGLDTSGVIDDATRDALRRAHGT